ncbi:YnjH family protein [Vibrio sp. SS-MA-C1-2]|uniref:DUF1496 domain-containing protein n=1 Tax=Vibrio sp. SS-MA-C1-2 TaxID=2908646 RepID=UPI001F3A0DC9|nr:DUF1496 domain-containing protein [Vibrio sp. SS-MA-C1-2]UJF17556.1 YnjH family protein [Vibrio sp. SS-MA-C1-2]
MLKNSKDKCGWKACCQTGGLLIAILSSFSLSAAIISTQPATELKLETNGDAGLRVCYFDGKSYSLGAVIQVEKILLQCVEANSNESNGALKWQKLSDQ